MELTANFTDRCDIDKNGTVSILDMSAIAQKYNTKNTDSNWSLGFDFNKDGTVDIFDLVLCSKRLN